MGGAAGASHSSGGRTLICRGEYIRAFMSQQHDGGGTELHKSKGIAETLVAVALNKHEVVAL